MLPEDDLRQQIAELSARVASLGATVSSLEAAVEPQCDHPAEPGAVGVEQVRPSLPVAFGGPPHLFRHGRVVYR